MDTAVSAAWASHPESRYLMVALGACSSQARWLFTGVMLPAMAIASAVRSSSRPLNRATAAVAPKIVLA
jgi:hypothetical protein